MMRNGTVDLLKVALALMVVSIHVNPFAALGPVALAITGDGVFRVAVPAFFVLNGYFLLPALVDGRAPAFLRRILGLYLIWTVIYLPLSFHDFAELPWLGDLRLAVFGFWHLWYLPALAIAAALAIPLRAWRAGRLLALAGAVFVMGALIPLGQAMGLWQVDDWMHRNGLFLGLPFLIAGLVIRKTDVARRAPPSVWMALAVGALALAAMESLALRGAPHWSAHDNLFSLALAAPLLVIAAVSAPQIALPRTTGTYANGLYFCHVGTLTLLQLVPALAVASPLSWALTVVTALAATALILRAGLARRLF